jgi:3',5'-cyclic AMP phosphodiesterase CpdA
VRRLAPIVAFLAAGCVGLGSAAPAPPDTGSTLVRTWIDPDHTGVLVPGLGEPLLPRTELAPAARLVRPLAAFAQITDAHVTDEESPARVEMLDRLGPPFTSAFRPQEALSPFVLAAVVRSVNRVHPQAVFETGDLIDNAQRNEMVQATAILRGGRVDPNSGQPGYDGVQDESNADPLIYRPAVDAPSYPRLLARAERPFTSPGLRAPWYPLPGNHDLQVQGNVPATPATQRVAVGDRKLLTVDRSTLEAARGEALDRRLIDRLLGQGLPGRTEFVPADPRRRELSPAQAVAALRAASSHGGSGRLMDDTVDLGPSVRAITVDTTSRRAGASGVLRQAQVTWLRSQLRAAGDRWLLVFSSTPLTKTAGAAGALDLLADDDHVVAAIAGDVHRNSITPVQTAAGGYWAITTSSLADYPQQARAFRLWQTSTGVALQTWMLDGDPAWRLASISRRLAWIDYQGGRPNHLAGTSADRNATLYR